MYKRIKGKVLEFLRKVYGINEIISKSDEILRKLELVIQKVENLQRQIDELKHFIEFLCGELNKQNSESLKYSETIQDALHLVIRDITFNPLGKVRAVPEVLGKVRGGEENLPVHREASETAKAALGNAVEIVFSLDEDYLKIFSVALASILANNSQDRKYTIHILHKAVSYGSQKAICDMAASHENFLVNFMDLSDYPALSERSNRYLPHVSGATYYRLHVYDIFRKFKKILYLDCDVVALDDVAKLYDVDLKGAWLGACRDMRERIAIRHNFALHAWRWQDYAKRELRMPCPEEYFQAGVLLINIEQHKEASERIFEEYRRLQEPVLGDQDVLNAACYGHIAWLPPQWNVQWQIPLEFAEYGELLGEDRQVYEKCLKWPALVHYASPIKPWNYTGWNRLAGYFYDYACKSPLCSQFGWPGQQ